LSNTVSASMKMIIFLFFILKFIDICTLYYSYIIWIDLIQSRWMILSLYCEFSLLILLRIFTSMFIRNNGLFFCSVLVWLCHSNDGFIKMSLKLFSLQIFGRMWKELFFFKCLVQQWHHQILDFSLREDFIIESIS
jgi:hypothetical protein